jgi:phosphatidylglycerophosphate synthase
MLADVGRDLVQRTLAPLVERMSWVNPNALTAAALGVSALAGTCFYLTDRDPIFFLIAALLGLVYGVLDALDGMIARTHGKVSAWGDFLDHTSDRLSTLFALGGLALAKHTNDVLVLLLMLGTLWHAYLGTQLEASFGRRVYRGVGIAEALIFACAYGVTAYSVLAAGLPFYFREPLTGATISVSDAFALLALPLVVIGTWQRIRIARAIADEPPR